jgi:ATP-dependent RNA helicase DeaD
MSLTPADKQIALFSATMSREVMDISWEYLEGAVNIDVAPKAEDMPQIKQ